MRTSFLAAALLLLPACSPLDLLNASIPAEGYSLEEGISYGALERQKLDLYLPAEAAGAARPPLVVFFYGGGWRDGAREDYRFAGQALAARGAIVVVPDYRLHPEVTFPAFLEDSARAVAWALAEVPRLGADPERVFLMGHSAGAYNAAMLASDRRYLEAEGAAPEDLAGVVGLAGPYDFLPLKDPKYIAVFEGPDRPETEVVTYVDGDEPPMLLLAGRDDETVKPANSESMAEELKAAGVAAELTLYPGLDHIDMVLALAEGFHDLAPVLEDSLAFMRRARPGE